MYHPRRSRSIASRSCSVLLANALLLESALVQLGARVVLQIQHATPVALPLNFIPRKETGTWYEWKWESKMHALFSHYNCLYTSRNGWLKVIFSLFSHAASPGWECDTDLLHCKLLSDNDMTMKSFYNLRFCLIIAQVLIYICVPVLCAILLLYWCFWGKR